MPFTPTAFQNSPSTATPITAAELDKLGTQHAQALADLREGVDSSGDTLAKLLALLGGKVSTADAAELIRDTVSAALVAGANVTITPNDAGDTITISASGIAPTLVDAKGDLIAGTANDTVARVAVGSNGQVLTADSAVPAGVKWETPAAGGGAAQPNWVRDGYSLPGQPILGYGSNGNITFGAGTYLAAPFTLSAQGTLTGLMTHVDTAGVSGSTARLGVYATGSTPQGPHTLVLDAGTASIASTGTKEVAANQVLPAGRYMAVLQSSHTFTPRLYNCGSLFGVNFSGMSRWALTATGAVGALPASLSVDWAPGGGSGSEPRVPVLVRFA